MTTRFIPMFQYYCVREQYGESNRRCGRRNATSTCRPFPLTMPSVTVTNADVHHSRKVKTAHNGKPILSWLQRKIAGTVRGTRKAPGVGSHDDLFAQPPRRRVTSLGEVRAVSIDVGSAPPSPVGISRHSSILGPSSIWSPTNPVEADDDASIRPLPPTSPPSPAPSRSSSSYLSDPRTFRSIGGSTKPTTILSIDITNTFPPVYSPGATQTVAFSPLPISPASSSRSPSQRAPPVQAPIHTAHHPRNNPRPSSPPLDNASMLTLASSAYAHVGRVSVWQAGEADSVSHVEADSVSQFPYDTQTYEDGGASLRALRPRSERRSSWESGHSDWSAVPGQGGSITGSAMGVGKDISAFSWKTGALTEELTHESRIEDDDEDDDIRLSVDLAVPHQHVSVADSVFPASPISPKTSEDACRTPPLTPTDAQAVVLPEPQHTPKKPDTVTP
ncbi:hypothetical protein BKA62DRAFT_705983 [Auriculariales sp. MPI-PUGE-AT-0066]|nr:hypothetical protein BKA62DRAFT_705983 [Auriculariales sp. MPI-PUGE-AT-0066]